MIAPYKVKPSVHFAEGLSNTTKIMATEEERDNLMGKYLRN